MNRSRDRDQILYIGLVTGNGGDAVQMLELAAGMIRRGRGARIMLPRVDATVAFAEQCQERGVPVERTSLLRADITGTRQNPIDVVRLFRQTSASTLHLHTGNDCLPRTVMLALALLRLPPAFVTLQSPYSTLRPGDARARAWAVAAPRQFRKVICPSEHALETQRAYGVPAPVLQCIYNGVDIARYAGGDGSLVRAELGLERDTPLIVFTSRMDRQKRPLDLLEAFVGIAAEFPAAHLAFVGTGALTEAVKIAAVDARVAARVHFAGHRSNIPDWLAAATVWAMPTESENFSLAILEALAAGCPVLSTWCRGNDEILVDNRNALTFPVGDVSAMTTALRRLLATPDLRSRLSAAARVTAQDHSLNRTIAAYAECYAASPDLSVTGL